MVVQSQEEQRTEYHLLSSGCESVRLSVGVTHTDRIYLLNKAFPQVVRERFTVQMRWETIINCALKKALNSTQ